MNIIVTGGAGFIGSEVIRQLIKKTEYNVINIDKLTYAGNLDSLSEITNNNRYYFEKIDICESEAVNLIFKKYRPNAVIHLAAESHVDRSINQSSSFIQTNIVGTHVLLEAARFYWNSLSNVERKSFRFLHVSTDEVYGSLGVDGFFSEKTAYKPNSPYSASKASADHLVRAWHSTYGIPTIITNCSNNYGPYQFPEKLIPLTIYRAVEGKNLPIYGKGENIRDWLYVSDHVNALRIVLEKGQPGQTYNIGGNNELTNIEVVKNICLLLDEMLYDSKHKPHEKLITFVEDRPGHDLRYAINADKIISELNWKPKEDFSSGLRLTVRWYLDNKVWIERIMSGAYRGERLGLVNN